MFNTSSGQRIRYVKEASGAKSTTQSFKYKSKECDLSANDSTSSAHLKPLIQVKQSYNQHFATALPLRKLASPQKQAPVDGRIVERTYSSVRTSNYVKRSSVAPEKRVENKSVIYEKRSIKMPICPPPSTNVIEEKLEDDQIQGQGSEMQSQKRRKSITFFELTANTNQQQDNEEIVEMMSKYSEKELKQVQNIRVIINGQFDEREIHVDISSIPYEWKLEQIAQQLNEIYKQQFNQSLRNPAISVLIGKIQTKKLSKDMKKYELVLMSLKGQLKESLIVLEDSY
ncbi:unnamed protein product [Paramecium primaurelia]|uniref:Uncharacterized protein n=2 Tax=Paramecium TaxID=5884 RepID=A0A8S1WTQ4_9CILI|nr:unnamed protein product [Paramecium primaurelia]CAD8192121.1 unnamed protein product [Paramecium pentaurelia]